MTEGFCSLFGHLFLTAGLLAAVRTDIRDRRIPNSIPKYLLWIWLFLTAANGCLGSMEAGTIQNALCGLLAGGLVSFLCSLLSGGGIGSGDVKLLAVTGLYMGYKGILAVFVRSMLAAGIICVFLLFSGRAGRKQKLPMAPFILLAVISVWLGERKMRQV